MVHLEFYSVLHLSKGAPSLREESQAAPSYTLTRRWRRCYCMSVCHHSVMGSVFILGFGAMELLEIWGRRWPSSLSDLEKSGHNANKSLLNTSGFQCLWEKWACVLMLREALIWLLTTCQVHAKCFAHIIQLDVPLWKVFPPSLCNTLGNLGRGKWAIFPTPLLSRCFSVLWLQHHYDIYSL